MDTAKQKYPPMRPRADKISVPLPEDKDLPLDVLQELKQMPALNNLRMFANVPSCFSSIKSLIDKLFNHGNLDPKLREYMYLRISFSCGVFYEFRHNRLFAEHLGIANEEIAILAKPEEVTQLGEEGNLVCKAAEEITDNISISDATLKSLLERFGKGTTCEIILLVSWFNMLIRYIESTRVPYEPDLENIITSASPV